MSKRLYAIIPAGEVSKINFNEILQTSEDTLRYSLDKSKAVIKWLEVEPLFLDDVQNVEGPYSHEEIISIMGSADWTDYSMFPDYQG